MVVLRRARQTRTRARVKRDSARVPPGFWKVVDAESYRENRSGASVATVAADGGAVHQLGLLTQAESLEWSVDGMNLLVPQQGRVSIVDVASGAVIRTIDFQSGSITLS